MRYNTILKEDGNIQEEIKSSILDMVIPLRAQGITSVTLKQIIDVVTSSDELMGLDLTPSYISGIANNIPGCSVSTDANGDKVVSISGLNPNVENNPKKSSEDEVLQAATDQANQELEQ